MIRKFLILILLSATNFAQVDAPSQFFNRGKLWQSVYTAKNGPKYNAWSRSGVGLDWPGFDASWIVEDIGGAPSYLVTGGLYIGCKKTNDSVLVADDWSMYGEVSADQGSKYLLTKHTHLFKNGENFWLQKNPNMGEEVIQSIWEYNVGYTPSYGVERQLPIRVTKTSQNWSGSKRDENYIIHEYVIKNISKEIKDHLDPVIDAKRIKAIADTLKDFYALLNYAMHCNSRAWAVNFPTEPPGAKNTWFFYEANNNLIYGKADDYKKTTTTEVPFGYSKTQGIIKDGVPQGEYLAPGFVGVTLLYSSPNKQGQTTKIVKYGWAAGDPSYDPGGAFVNKDTEESQYNVCMDPTTAKNYIVSPSDTAYMRKSRMWSLMNCGPWDLTPGDSIVIAFAEVVDGVDYNLAVDPTNTSKTIQDVGKKNFDNSVKEAKLTYDNKYRHPNPPGAPKFTVDFYKERKKFVANQIVWGTDTENLTDPDAGTSDLAGYKLYRSSFLPIGPWNLIATIKKDDPLNFDGINYRVVDSLVSIGSYYYYALTAYDTGKASWLINPAAIFPETKSNKVPPLESSIFANRMTTPFLSTLPPSSSISEVLVVPNPFVFGAGDTQLAGSDEIQFVNLPNPCTIRIYTVRGDLVKTIDVAEGVGGIVSWNQLTDFGQFIESGVYVFHIESPSGNKKGKFAVVR